MIDFSDIIVSSRVRLARNLYKTPFPTNKAEQEGQRVLELVTKALNKAGVFHYFKMNKTSELDRQIMYEKHLISKELLENLENGAVAISFDETLSIMINEEDHIRAQCVLRGFQLPLAYEKLNKIDDVFIKELQLEFDTELGFLTACPSNVGTGMRASVMLFLPALSMSGAMNSLILSASKMGLAVRGVYGEGSAAEGYMYQVSNQRTLGLSEADIIKNVEMTTNKLVEMEKEARIKLKKENEDEIKDLVYRAYGILSSCYKISSSEFMQLIGQLKLGVSLQLIELKNRHLLNDLLKLIQPATLVKISGKQLSALERDKFRAEYLHKVLNNTRI